MQYLTGNTLLVGQCYAILHTTCEKLKCSCNLQGGRFHPGRHEFRMPQIVENKLKIKRWEFDASSLTALSPLIELHF